MNIDDEVGKYHKGVLKRWREVGYEFDMRREGADYAISVTKDGEELGEKQAMFPSHALTQAENICITHYGKLWYE